MKTRALTELLASTSAPALLLNADRTRWCNNAFNQLPESERNQIEHWGTQASNDILLSAGTLFERLSAGDHTLIIASGHRAARQQRALMQALIPLLQEDNNPFFVLPQILSQLLGWQASAACTLLKGQQLGLVGHWDKGAQQPPQTLALNNNLATSLYSESAGPTQIQEWDEPTHDPLLPAQGIWLGQRIDNTEGQGVGHLAVWDSAPYSNLADSIHLLQLCADLIGAWLSSETPSADKQHFQQDPLTLLPQRDALDHALVQCEQAYAEKDTLLALIDIDGLSHINTEHGQQAGDRVLCTFADKLRHICRPDDQLFRLGGDEFVLLMPTGKQSSSLLKRLEQVNRSMSEQLGTPFHASIGVARLNEANGSGDDLLLLANGRLVHAKQAP